MFPSSFLLLFLFITSFFEKFILFLMIWQLQQFFLSFSFHRFHIFNSRRELFPLSDKVKFFSPFQTFFYPFLPLEFITGSNSTIFFYSFLLQFPFSVCVLLRLQVLMFYVFFPPLPLKFIFSLKLLHKSRKFFICL